MTDPPRRRHVWVRSPLVDQLRPGLVVAWRKTTDGQWEAQVATASSGGLHIAWTSVDAVSLLKDDQIEWDADG
jgi:hypothetical protein